MTSRLLVAAAVLVAANQAGWAADKAKKKKKTPDAATVQKSKWEYKLVRADELVPKDATSTSTSGSSSATTDDMKAQLADALNKLGEEGWELVWVDAPPRPIAGGVIGMTAGGFGGFGGGAAGGFGGAPGGFDTGRPDFDRMWQSLADGKDKVDLNDPANKALRDRFTSRGQKVPDDGILTKALFKEATERRMGEQQAASRRATLPAGPGATYYLKRAKG